MPFPLRSPCWKMLTPCSLSFPSPIQLIHLCNTVSNLKPFCHICWRDNGSFSLTFCQLSVVEVFQLITWCKSYKINTQWEGESVLVSCLIFFLVVLTLVDLFQVDSVSSTSLSDIAATRKVSGLFFFFDNLLSRWACLCCFLLCISSLVLKRQKIYRIYT